MKNLKPTIALLFLFTQPSLQADNSDGKAFHDASCVRCHSSDAYTRDDAKIKTLPALGTQVRFCKDNLGLSWFDEDVSNVVTYLNKQYYKF